MLDPDIIYRKSARGSEAIAGRQAALGPRQRSLLILVDGRRGFHELATLGAALGSTAELLQDLLAQGYIEPGPLRSAGVGAAPAPVIVARKVAVGPTELRVPLEQARSFAVARLSDLLGPAGTDLCRRIEASRSAHEFRAAVRRTETSLREVVGPELTEQFVREVENLRAN